jgi:hypothetical protein
MSFSRTFSTLTRTKSGYSTGWTEQSRNNFHISALHLIMTGKTGLASLSMIHATELISHHYNKREWCQPHINSDSSIDGFFYNAYPLFVKFKQQMDSSYPHISTFFNNMNDSSVTKYWIDAIEKDNLVDVDKYSNIMMQHLTNVFGEYIIVYPSDYEAPDQLTSFLNCFNGKKHPPIILARIQ